MRGVVVSSSTAPSTVTIVEGKEKVMRNFFPDFCEVERKGRTKKEKKKNVN